MGAFYRWVFEGVWPPVEEAAISRHVSLLPSNWFQFNKPRKRKHAASSPQAARFHLNFFRKCLINIIPVLYVPHMAHIYAHMENKKGTIIIRSIHNS